MKKNNGEESKTSGGCLWYARTHSDESTYIHLDTEAPKKRANLGMMI